MKKLYFILLFIFFTLNSCFKNDVYKGDTNTNLPDLSVSASFDWNEVYISIPLTNGVEVSDISVSFPVLKYNKDFVYSYTFDDDVVQAYGKAFCTINKKWVDDENHYHVGQNTTTGTTPSKTLGYTDGCGNEKRFNFGVAIWPDMYNDQIDNFMAPTEHRADRFYPYLVWKDIVPLLDFGNDIYLHDVAPSYDDSNIDGVVIGLKACNQETKNRIGRKMKILARPNGNNVYIAAGRQYEDIVFMAVENNTDMGVPSNIYFDTDQNLKKVTQYRRYIESMPTVAQLMPDIDAKASSGTYAWIHDFSHGPANFQYILDLFTTINNKYGKDGEDDVWFATLDEVYEYNYLKRNCIITPTISGNVLTLKIACPSTELPDEFIFHRDFSILLKGVTLQSNTSISSGKNVYGLSYAKQDDDSWLINVNCNKSLLDKATRYTDAYEKDKSSSTKEDALYFINQLKESYKTDAMKNLSK